MAQSIVIHTIILFLLSALLVFDCIWILLKTPFVYLFKDKPGMRKIHQQTVPRAGGICVAFSFLVILFLWNYWAPAGFPRLSTLLYDTSLFITLCIFAIGFFDDSTTFLIVNKAKFFLEILVAAEIVYFFGIQLPEIRMFGLVIANRTVLACLSIFWIVGISNAVNIIDGIDGLAGTITTISFLTVGILFLYANSIDAAILCFMLSGVIVGFLFHNISPARVFLGDTGSLLLGMILSVLLIYLVGAHETGFSAATLFFVAGFPIIDVSVAMIRRFFRSFFADKGIYQSMRAMTVADSEHTHHRLVYRGLNHTQSVLILATFSATLCIAAILIRLFPGYKYFFEVYSAIIIVSFLYRLNYFDRFTKAIRNRIHHGNKKGLFRIGVVDADPALYHAMINYNQRKFSMEFISRTEINANDSILGVQLQPAMHLHDQFMISSIWDHDTRQIPTALISKAMEAVAEDPRMEDDGFGNFSGPSYALQAQNRKYSAVLINCRGSHEVEEKLILAVRLLTELSCMVIISVEEIPVSALLNNGMRPQILFIKKPFYIPIFFSELNQVSKEWNNWKNVENLLKETTVLKTCKG